MAYEGDTHRPLRGAKGDCGPQAQFAANVLSFIEDTPLCISPFVADRYWQFRYCDLSDQVEKVPLVLAIGLDLEHVHRLQCLMIVLSENYPALRRVEFHPFHGGDQLLSI